jgi:antitoxin component of RelBE/YafQ-DinJ toxin-antitoxin module
MNITLSIDEQTVKEARKVAQAMGKSLNQLIREDLQRLTRKRQLESDLEELRSLDGAGNSQEWKFNREKLYERT